MICGQPLRQTVWHISTLSNTKVLRKYKHFSASGKLVPLLGVANSGGISFESLGYPASCTPVLKSAHRIIHSTTQLKIHDFSGF